MMPALQKKLVATETKSFFDFLPVRFNIGDVGFSMSGYTVEITELAIRYADIGCVYIPVYLPGYFSVWHLCFAKLISNKHQLCQWSMMIKKNTFFNRKKIKLRSVVIKIV